jgi:hypothetical protein
MPGRLEILLAGGSRGLPTVSNSPTAMPVFKDVVGVAKSGAVPGSRLLTTVSALRTRCLLNFWRLSRHGRKRLPSRARLPTAGEET